MSEAAPTKVGRLDVVHNGDCRDGYSTHVRIDGKIFPYCTPPRYERKITVTIEACEKPHVEVEFKNGTVEVFEPDIFEMVLGDLQVRTHPKRMPCQILLGGYEPKIRNLKVKFEEGEAVWVNLEVLPTVSSYGSDEPSIRFRTEP